MWESRFSSKCPEIENIFIECALCEFAQAIFESTFRFGNLDWKE